MAGLLYESTPALEECNHWFIWDTTTSTAFTSHTLFLRRYWISL